MSAWIASLTDWLSVHPQWLVAALFLAAALESLALVGLVIPGVAVLFALSVLAGKTGLTVPALLLWTTAGAVIGDGISFWLGRHLQGRLDVVWPFSRYPALMARGERFFRQHGGKSVALGRFVGPIRPVIPIIAGALAMSWQRFLAVNITSALLWAPVYTLPGFLVGDALQQKLALPPHFYAALGVSLLILAGVYLVLIQFQLGLGRGGRLYAWMEGAVGRYDASHRFWRLYESRRPDAAGEFPLGSVVLAATGIALFLLWAHLTASGALAGWDQRIAAAFADLRHPLLDTPALALTLLGDPAMLVAAAILATLTMAFRGYYAAALHVLLAALGTVLLVWGLKAGFALPRPELVQHPPGSGAFPSGHATGITVLTMLGASFVAAEQPMRRRWRVYAVASVPLLLVAVSRLYLGVHWFTDVVGGVLIGLAVTGLIRASYSRYDRLPLSPDLITRGALALWLVLIAGYVWANWTAAEAGYAPVTPIPTLPAAPAGG